MGVNDISMLDNHVRFLDVLKDIDLGHSTIEQQTSKLQAEKDARDLMLLCPSEDSEANLEPLPLGSVSSRFADPGISEESPSQTVSGPRKPVCVADVNVEMSALESLETDDNRKVQP